MAEGYEFHVKLQTDLIEQFKDKPRIEALLEVIARQLQDVKDFYDQLIVERILDNAKGLQLDGIGDIVCLTRNEAKKLASGNSTLYENEDELYRTFLRYKIFVNTAECNYDDIMKSISILWGGEISYSETVEEPATITLGFERFNGDNHKSILSVPIIKSGGVGIKFRTRTNGKAHLYVGASTSAHRKITYTTGEAAVIPDFYADENGSPVCDENYNIILVN